ncbi:hypothetical protein K8R33_04205 [archaeon]|nr:hypothetical protein [archaeon]
MFKKAEIVVEEDNTQLIADLVQIELDKQSFEENSIKVGGIGMEMFYPDDEEIINNGKLDTDLEPEIIEYENYVFLYSYYNPALGGVNCHEDNWDVNYEMCKNTTASGKGWKEYIKKGVAIHPDLLNDLPFGTIIEVTDPIELVGEYEVIDLCMGCLPRGIDQYYYIDFLDRIQVLAWSEEVKIKVKK